MTLSDFNNIKSVKEMNSMGMTISHGHTLPDYYDSYMNNRESVRMLETYFTYIFSTGRSLIRYIEVEIDSDVVTIVFEAVFYSNPSQMRVYELPVSKSGNRDNVMTVVKSILNKEFKTTFFVSESDMDTLGVEGIEPHDGWCNFYDTYDFVMGSRYTQKMKTKYRFKYLDEHCKSYFYKSLDYGMKESVVELRSRWEETYPGNVHNSKSFMKALNFVSDDTVNMLTYYDDELVHYNKLYVIPNGVVRVFSCNASRCKTENDSRNKDVYNIDRYTRIPLLEYVKEEFGVDRIYHLSLGCNISKSMQGLYDYKRRTHEGRENYCLINSDVLKELIG